MRLFLALLVTAVLTVVYVFNKSDVSSALPISSALGGPCADLDISEELGELIQAGEYGRVEEVLDSLQELPRRAVVALALAEQALRMRETEIAVRFSSQAEQYYSTRGCNAKYAQSLVISARAYWYQSDYYQSILQSNDALALARESNVDDVSVESLGILFNIFTTTGNYELAKKTLAEKTAVMDHEALRTKIISNSDQGYLELEFGNYGLALHAYSEALEAAKGIDNPEGHRALHLNLAHANIELGRAEQAEKHWLEANRLADVNGKGAFALAYYRGLIDFRRGDYTKALASFEESLRLDIPNDWKWEAHHFAGQSASKLGHSKLAAEHFSSSVDSLEAFGHDLVLDGLRSNLLTKRRAPYESLFLAEMENGNENEALHAIERAKSQAFYDAMRANSKTLLSENQSSLKSLTQHIESLRPYLTSNASSPRSPLVVPSKLVMSLSDENVLMFHRAHDQLWLTSLRKGAVQYKRIDLDYSELVSLLTSYVADPDNLSVLDRLGQSLLPHDMLPGSGEHLYIVPDIELSSVMWSGLRVNNQYLIERNTISMFASLNALNAKLTLTAHAPQEYNQIAVLADSLGDLPSAKTEADVVGKLYGVESYTGTAATTNRLNEALEADLLHLATHAGRNHLGPWLQLSDKSVFFHDIIAGKAAPALVVLASCASASPNEDNLWGSLGAAFLIKGSRHVVAAHRSVRDTSSAPIMNDFHRKLSRTDGVSRALALAQRQALDRGVPAREWASFIVLGLE